MSKVKTGFIFLLGLAIGGAGAWYYLKNTYEQRSEQDIASAKEAFHSREVKLLAEIEELKKKTEPEKDEAETAPTVLANGKVQDKGDVVEYARGKYTQYTPSVVPQRPAPEEHKADNIEAPYVISPDEFGEIDGYAQISLTYYADGILADENGVIIDDIEEIVGDAINHFGEYEDDSVFCRSDPKRCDYEILQDLRRYADVRKSFPPNM